MKKHDSVPDIYHEGSLIQLVLIFIYRIAGFMVFVKMPDHVSFIDHLGRNAFVTYISDDLKLLCGLFTRLLLQVVK